nr:hypothetical protein Iba_scaffold2019CG0120 [Ipomoea batatas]
MPQCVEIATEPPEEDNAEPTVYIPVPAETHDVLTQEEIDFEMALSSFNFDDLTLPNVRLEQANEAQGEADPVEEDEAVQGEADEGEEDQVEEDEADQVEEDEADQVEAQVAEPQEDQIQPPPSQKKKQRLKLQVTRKYRTRSSNVMKFCGNSKEPINID